MNVSTRSRASSQTIPRWTLIRTATLWSTLLGAGCSSPDTTETATQPIPDVRDVDGGPGCLEAACFFEQELWDPTLSTKCLFCHYADGPAKASELVLVEPASSGDWQSNFAAVCAVALTYDDGVSRLLLKPSYQTDHGGGLRAAPGSEEYAMLEAFVARAEAMAGCRCDACDMN